MKAGYNILLFFPHLNFFGDSFVKELEIIGLFLSSPFLCTTCSLKGISMDNMPDLAMVPLKKSQGASALRLQIPRIRFVREARKVYEYLYYIR